MSFGSTKLMVYYYSVDKLWGGTRKYRLFRCPEWFWCREILPLKLERGWTTYIYCFHPIYGDYQCINLNVSVCLFLG